MSSYDPYNEGTRSPPPAPRISLAARPEPEGVQILDGHRRVGTTQRDTYLEHLSDLLARGYLSAEEFEARQNAAQKAETEWDLNRLIADTPGLIEPSVTGMKRVLRSPASLLSWFAAHRNTPLIVIGFLAWLMASIAWATIPPATLGFYRTPQSGFAVAMVIFFILTAVASFIIEVAVFVGWMDG